MPLLDFLYSLFFFCGLFIGCKFGLILIFIKMEFIHRDFSGLQGVLFSPFIHENLDHLYNNSIPLLVLLAAMQFFYPKQTLLLLVMEFYFRV